MQLFIIYLISTSSAYRGSTVKFFFLKVSNLNTELDRAAPISNRFFFAVVFASNLYASTNSS